jgi:hypothetical protein
MSGISTEGLKLGRFETWAMTEAKEANKVKTIPVNVDNRAATRQAIILALRKEGFVFETRSDWKARPNDPKKPYVPDWDYANIALHHAGNSYSCSADDVDQLRKAEATDFKRFGRLSYHYAISCSGMVYEALDIREKGAHIASGNTGVIGIVMLADFSKRGESYEQEYSKKTDSKKTLKQQVEEISEWGLDALDVFHDEPTGVQVNALRALVKTLQRYFPVRMLGGHREYQVLANHEGRACPGAHGMRLVTCCVRSVGWMSHENEQASFLCLGFGFFPAGVVVFGH